MKNKLELYGKAANGVLEYNDKMWKEKYREFVKESEGKDIQITIKSIKDSKTLAQLRFYWGVLLPAICKATGNTDREEIHGYLKAMYIVEIHEVKIKDKVYVTQITPSLSDIDIDSMREYIERVMEFLVDNGGSLDHDDVDYYESTRQI